MDTVKNSVCWLIFILSFSPKINSTVYPSIQWNPLNPIFKGNVNLNVLRSSKINFVCPNEATVMETTKDNTPTEQLYENFWLVDKASYDSCHVNLTKAKPLKKCSNPSGLDYIAIVFNQYSATKNGLTFKPGDDYYFVGTSDGTMGSLNNTSGGHCKTHNMRIKIHVCLDNDPLCIGTTTSAPTTTVTTTPVPRSTTPNVASTSPPNKNISANASQPPTHSSSQTVIICKPVTQTSQPTEVTTPSDEKRWSEKPGNKTAQVKPAPLSTTPGSGPDTEFSGRRNEDCDMLGYQLAIAFLLALSVCLLILSIHMYLRFHGRNLLSLRWLKSAKKPRVKKVPAVNLKHQNSTCSTRHMIRWSVASIGETNGNNNPEYNPELASSNA